jgi:hypothetical protein
MATKYKGEVEFQDSEGQTFVLRLSTFQYVSIQQQAEKLDGRGWQLFILHQALMNGAESQKKMTKEEAGEILDDIGYLKADELISATKFGLNSKQAADEVTRRRTEAVKEANQALAAKVTALKRGVTDEALLAAIDLVAAKVTEGSDVTGNPLQAAISSNS